MKLRDKILFSLIFFSAFCFLLYSVKSILTPFIFSLVVAYFLDPAVGFLQKYLKLSRSGATLSILGLFFAVITSLSVVLLPVIYVQFIDLLDALPLYFQTITSDFYPKLAVTLNKFGFKLEDDFSNLIANHQINEKFISVWQDVIGNAISSSKALINLVSVLFIAPILIFYLLKDWNLLVRKVNIYLPKRSALTIKRLAYNIDKTLSGYVRGQFNVCLILAIIYSSLLSLTGLDFGFLIGFLTGIFSFIPFIGMLCGVIAAIIVGLFQWGFDFSHAAAITGVFVFGQVIESNFLTPKLIGSKVGLHPVWMIFGLFFFGTTLGFLGVLIAIPATAVSGVIIKHFALTYKRKYT